MWCHILGAAVATVAWRTTIAELARPAGAALLLFILAVFGAVIAAVPRGARIAVLARPTRQAGLLS